MRLKKKKKNIFVVEPGAFRSVVRCVTDGVTRVHIHDWIFNRYKDKNMFYGLWGNFYIEFQQLLKIVFHPVRVSAKQRLNCVVIHG